MNNFKYYFLISILIFGITKYVYSKGISTSIGFVNDRYGTMFYYDKDNYYVDGWHLIDDNGDGIYEYYYFSLSGHMLKDTIAPNGYQINLDGKLVINDILYQVSLTDIIDSNYAVFLNKKETVDELTKGFEIDYNQVFNEWYIKSKIDIISQLNSITNNPTVQKVNRVKDEISKKVKECKKIAVWYNDRLYDTKEIRLIDKDTYKSISRNLQKDMSEYVNKFREEMGNNIKSIGY